MKRYLRLIVLFLIIFCLTACGKNNIIQEINDHILQTVQIEKEFVKDGKQIYLLEEKDQKLYEEMIALGEEDYDDIKKLADKAIGLLEERRGLIEKEKATMDESKSEFMKIEPLLDMVKDKDKGKQVKELAEVMLDRYELYDEVYEKYNETLELTEKLYELFKKNKVRENELYVQLNQINESYASINDTYEGFNYETEKFNDLKKEFIRDGAADN